MSDAIGITDEAVIARLKVKMNYRDNRHCKTCRYHSEKDLGLHECHMSPLFPFRVSEEASCQYHQHKGES